MRERLTKLVDVKSIVTLMMTFGLVFMMVTGIKPSQEVLSMYCTAYGSVMTYYFTRKDTEGMGPMSNKLDLAIPLLQNPQGQKPGLQRRSRHSGESQGGGIRPRTSHRFAPIFRV